MRSALGLAVLSALSAANAAYQGFNYGSAFHDGSHKIQSDFEAEFKTAQNLSGAPGAGFTSARLYTMIVSPLLSRATPPPQPPSPTNNPPPLARRNPLGPHLRHPRRHRYQHHPPPRRLVLRRRHHRRQRAGRPKSRHRHARRRLCQPRRRHLGRQRGPVPQLADGGAEQRGDWL